MAFISCKNKGAFKISQATLIQSYTLAGSATLTSLNISVDPSKTYAFASHDNQSDQYKPVRAIISNNNLVMGNPSIYTINAGKLEGPALASATMYIDWFELT